MTRLRALFLPAFFAVAACAHGAVYQVDSNASAAQFEVETLGSGKVSGRLGFIRGRVEVDELSRGGTADMLFDMNAVETGRDILNRLIRSHYVFDTEQYPFMRFRSNQLEFDGTHLAAAQGVLSLHGVTRPVQLQIRSFACEDMASKADSVAPARRCSGIFETTILRSDFGMNKLGLMVEDQVHITVKLSLDRQAAEIAP